MPRICFPTTANFIDGHENAIKRHLNVIGVDPGSAELRLAHGILSRDACCAGEGHTYHLADRGTQLLQLARS
jgi:hypothetical protein